MAMRKYELILVIGALAAVAVGCAQVEPHVETAKDQVSKADAYLSELVGVEKVKPPRSLSATDTAPPAEVKAK